MLKRATLTAYVHEKKSPEKTILIGLISMRSWERTASVNFACICACVRAIASLCQMSVTPKGQIHIST